MKNSKFIVSILIFLSTAIYGAQKETQTIVCDPNDKVIHPVFSFEQYKNDLKAYNQIKKPELPYIEINANNGLYMKLSARESEDLYLCIDSWNDWKFQSADIALDKKSAIKLRDFLNYVYGGEK